MKLSKDKSPAAAAAPKEKKPFLDFSFGKKKPDKATEIDPESFVFTPTLPKVNVIPSSLTEKYEIKGVVRKSVFAGVGLVAVLALAWAGGNFYVGTLNSELDAIKAEESQLVEQVAALTPYEEYKNAVAAKRTALSAEVSTDINMSVIYNDMYNTATGQNLELTTIQIAQTEEGSAENGCANPEPFSEVQNVVGCINISGNGNDPEGGRYFVESLLTVSNGARYVNPFVSSVAVSEEGTNFEASVFFTTDLYTGQYADLELSLDDLLAASAPPATEEGEEVETGEIAEVTFSSPTTLQAQTLVPDLAESDLQVIETAATGACATGDLEAPLLTIQAVLETRLPADDPSIDGYMEELTTTLTAECGGA